MKTVARPATAEPGIFFEPTDGSTAASNWIGPSTISSGARSRTISVAARVRPVARPFDAYAVLSGPGGTWSMTPGGGLAVGIRPYAAAAALGQSVDAALLDAEIPPGTAPGAWTVYAGLVPRRAKPSPANAFALDTVRITVRE